MSTGSDTPFRRSSYCADGSCIEVGFQADGTVAVRDAKRPNQPRLVVTETTWDRFQEAIRAGRFDR